MRANRRFLGLVLAFVAIAALGGFTFLKMKAAKDADGAEDGADSAAVRARLEETAGSSASTSNVAIPVEGVEVVQDTLVVSVTATGQAAPQRQVVISAQVPGRVVDLPIRESGRVAGSALLVGMDAAEYRIALEQAKARMRSAEATFREQTLFDDKIEDAALRAERQRTARAKSGLDAAELDVQKAELDLARTRLGAPFAGQVANLKVVPGQHVTTGTELATLVDLDPIKVEVQVLESEVGFLSPGRKANVSFAAYPGESFTGTIETINPLVDQTTRTARVTVVVRNPQQRILPGMYARVSLEARRFPDRVIVPRAAVLERDRRTMVFVHEEGMAKWRYVTLGLGNNTQVEIVEDPETQGVKPGEVVLTAGHFTLTDGARVKLVESAETADGRRP
jgi:HlyD family secretion protein